MKKLAPLFVILGAISYAMVGIVLEMATYHGYPIQRIIVGMYLFYFIFLYSLYIFSNKNKGLLSKKETLIFLGLGGFTISITYCFYSSLRCVGVPMATLLLMQSSWITPVFSAFIGKNKIVKKDILSMLLIILGVFVSLVGQNTNISLLGVVWGVGAAMSYSLMILCSSYLACEKNILEKSAIMSLGAFILSLFLFKDQSIVSFFDERTYWSILYALFSTILPLTLLSLGLKHISMNLAGALITLEIPSAYFLSHIFLSQKITVYQILGCIMITLTISVPKIYLLYLNKKA
ncbi:DMT family transporter [Acinetobacter pollinis]|uniref:DMT family transporter n=1 Tax=Acinetobacter pollinis TaxID=2605270 RepID=UPI0018C29F4D|nr:DMT family transporter [Acinetobacter pollinis]MBF7691985.1 DMT family transporter [Acinetobacter pollinis]MBF7700090.1 DMT family transporter [Acinetobacter pollinis]